MLDCYGGHCRPGLELTERPAGFFLPHPGNKGLCHHTLPFLFLLLIFLKDIQKDTFQGGLLLHCGVCCVCHLPTTNPGIMSHFRRQSYPPPVFSAFTEWKKKSKVFTALLEWWPKLFVVVFFLTTVTSV